MCDIYDHQCHHEACTQVFNMHLVDFKTDRDEIEVYCRLHMPKDRNDGIVWKAREGKAHFKFFVKCLTDNAKKHYKGNCYNGDCEAIEIFGNKRNIHI